MNARWCDAPTPIAPRGVIGLGPVAHALLRAVEKDPQRGCMAVAADGLLVLTGETGQLPWVDGVRYISPCAEASGLWLPTTRHPEVPLDLLARALARRHGEHPLLLLEQPSLLLSLARLLPVDARWLQHLRQRWVAA